ncbi:MAG: hypothetical protein ACXWMJ_08395, partial [Syntrophales bacterium]
MAPESTLSLSGKDILCPRYIFNIEGRSYGRKCQFKGPFLISQSGLLTFTWLKCLLSLLLKHF